MSAKTGRWLLLAAGIGLSAGIMAETVRAGEDSGALALIGVNAREGGIEVIGGALAVEAGTFRGQMVINRQGAAGSLSTNQTRELVLAAGEQADIARVGVSYQPGDRLTVTVTLTRDGSVISEATLSTAEN